MEQKIELSTSRKIAWIQFICSLVIITNHSFDYMGFGASQMGFWSSMFYFITKLFSSSLTWIAMQIFFLLSGFLMYKDWNEKEKTGKWYVKKMKGRVKSLLFPYLAWNTIWTITFIAIGFSGVIDNNIDTTISVSNLFQGVVLAKYNEIFWFMEILIFYVIISPLFGYAMDSKYSMAFLLLLSLLATNTIPIKPVLGQFNIIQNYYNLFFYCVGAYLSINKGSFINREYTRLQSIFAGGG